MMLLHAIRTICVVAAIALLSGCSAQRPAADGAGADTTATAAMVTVPDDLKADYNVILFYRGHW